MPGDWREVALGDLFKVKHGFAFKGEYFTDEPQPTALVTPGNFAIGGGFQDEKPKYYRGPVPDDYALKPGQIVVTMTDLSKQSDTLGYAASIPNDSKVWLHNQRVGLLVLNPDSQTVPRFIQYLLRSHKYRAWIVGSATGTTVKHTSPGRIESFVTRVPPPDEQQAIAHILGTLDDKIELNRRRNQTLEAMARALFQDWFVDFGPVRAKMEGREPYLPADLWQLFPDRLDDEGKPERWKTKPLSDLCTLGRGASPRPISDYMNGEVPWVKIADATASNGPFLFETKERVTTAGAEKSVPVVPGDLILSNSATCGVPMFVELNGCIHDGWLYFKNLKLISKMYLFHVLVELAEHLVQIADGSVQKNLNTKLVGQQSVLVPEPAIVESFDVRTNCWFATMRQNTLESRTLAQLRDSLLPKLISGELHIADAEGILEMRL